MWLQGVMSGCVVVAEGNEWLCIVVAGGDEWLCIVIAVW